MISIKRRRVVAGIGAAVAAAMSGFGQPLLYEAGDLLVVLDE